MPSMSAAFATLLPFARRTSTYRVQFDNAKLIDSCIEAVRDTPDIPRARLQWRKADIAISKAGVEAEEKGGASVVHLDEGDIELSGFSGAIPRGKCPR
jgi:type III restriction enzyme